jgi:hypothetical protein
LKCFAGEQFRDANFFRSVLESSVEDTLRFIAAVGLTEVALDDVEAAVLDLLVHYCNIMRHDPFRGSDGLADDHGWANDDDWRIDWGYAGGAWGLDLVLLAADAIRKLSPPRQIDYLIAVFNAVKDLDYVHDLAVVLAATAFGDLPRVTAARSRSNGRKRIEYFFKPIPPRRSASQLDERQVRVLDAIVRHERLWQMDTNLLEGYGIPSTRDALLQWLNGT